jgi:hypothetical protein
MKITHSAYVFVVVLIRLTAVFLVLEFIYSATTTSLAMPSGMGGMISGFMFRAGLVRVGAAIILWFIARPVGKLVLRDIDPEKGESQ